MLTEQECNSCLLDAQPSWRACSVPPPAHPIWELCLQAKAGHRAGHCRRQRGAGRSCPQWCAGPLHGQHLWTVQGSWRGTLVASERPYGIAAFSEIITKWLTFEKKKDAQTVLLCKKKKKSSVLLRSLTYHTGWTWQSFNKRLPWRAEPVRLQKKCQPQKINTALHHVQVRHSTATRRTCTSTLQEKLSQLSRKQQVPH